jgi:hypothetical protein
MTQRHLVVLACALGALNVAAFALWLASSRLRVVLRRRGGGRPAAAPCDAPLPAAMAGGALEAWISEVEGEERPGGSAGAASGTAEWWRDWAAAGGRLPSERHVLAADATPAGAKPARRRAS